MKLVEQHPAVCPFFRSSPCDWIHQLPFISTWIICCYRFSEFHLLDCSNLWKWMHSISFRRSCVYLLNRVPVFVLMIIDVGNHWVSCKKAVTLFKRRIAIASRQSCYYHNVVCVAYMHTYSQPHMCALCCNLMPPWEAHLRLSKNWRKSTVSSDTSLYFHRTLESASRQITHYLTQVIIDVIQLKSISESLIQD